jgi:hypothetical protein
MPVPRPGRGPLFPGLRAGGVAGAAAGRPWRTSTGGIARGSASIGGRLAALEASQLAMRTGSVTAFTSTAATVNLGGESMSDVNMLASYSPTIGDNVVILQAPGLLIILGKAK